MKKLFGRFLGCLFLVFAFLILIPLWIVSMMVSACLIAIMSGYRDVTRLIVDRINPFTGNHYESS